MIAHFGFEIRRVGDDKSMPYHRQRAGGKTCTAPEVLR